MARPDRHVIRFVRALLPDGTAKFDGTHYVLGTVKLEARIVQELISTGALAGDREACRAAAETRAWLKRAMLTEDAHAAQHRLEARTPHGVTLNLAESPLARLATPHAGEKSAFLARHQVEAGERVRRLTERAQLQPRVTMSYSAAHTAGGKRVGHATEISDMAADARRALAEIHRVLPQDCADVVLDVCGLLKGLQTVELERGWPRRSAKLVLRIGLEQLAKYYGLAPVAVGPQSRRSHHWLGEGARPQVFE